MFLRGILKPNSIQYIQYTIHCILAVIWANFYDQKIIKIKTFDFIRELLLLLKNLREKWQACGENRNCQKFATSMHIARSWNILPTLGARTFWEAIEIKLFPTLTHTIIHAPCDPQNQNTKYKSAMPQNNFLKLEYWYVPVDSERSEPECFKRGHSCTSTEYISGNVVFAIWIRAP